MQVVATLSLAFAPPWQVRQLAMPGINTSLDCVDFGAPPWQSSHFTVVCLAWVNFASAYHTPDTRTGATCQVSSAVRGAVTLWQVLQALPVNRLSVASLARWRAQARASCCCCCDSGGAPGRRRCCTMSGERAS